MQFESLLRSDLSSQSLCLYKNKFSFTHRQGCLVFRDPWNPRKWLQNLLSELCQKQ